jgi:hypothetical protein
MRITLASNPHEAPAFFFDLGTIIINSGYRIAEENSYLALSLIPKRMRRFLIRYSEALRLSVGSIQCQLATLQIH